MRIQIDYDVSDEAVARVQQLLDDTALRDVDFNGEAFEIERGDGTEILDNNGRDHYDTQRLFNAIMSSIDGTIDTPEGYRRDSTGAVFRA